MRARGRLVGLGEGEEEGMYMVGRRDLWIWVGICGVVFSCFVYAGLLKELYLVPVRTRGRDANVLQGSRDGYTSICASWSVKMNLVFKLS